MTIKMFNESYKQCATFNQITIITYWVMVYIIWLLYTFLQIVYTFAHVFVKLVLYTLKTVVVL